MEAEEEGEEEDEMARKLLHGFTVSFYFLFFLVHSLVGWFVRLLARMALDRFGEFVP